MKGEKEPIMKKEAKADLKELEKKLLGCVSKFGSRA